MFEFFERIFVLLDRHDNHVVIMAVYLSLAALLVVLRIGAHLHFRGALFAFHTDSRREINSREEIRKIKNKLLRRAVAEYIRMAERAVTAVPTRQIVERSVANMGFFGWRYESLLPFVEGMEIGLLWVGLILAFVFDSYAFVYGLLAIILFIVLRIIAAFFNVRNAWRELTDEIILYIEREIGRFFASDTGGAILRLKNDLTEAIDRQSKTYQATMENIGRTMTEAMTQVTDSMISAANSIGPIVATAMDEKLVDMNATLTTVLNDWERALSESADIQTSMNTSSERLSYAGGQLQSAAELLATHMKGHSNALSEQLITLVSAIDAVKDSQHILTSKQEAFTKQAEYIESNQRALDSSLASYEASLQSLVQSLGNGLGAYINLHAQSSAQTVNDAFKANIDRLIHLLSTRQNGN